MPLLAQVAPGRIVKGVVVAVAVTPVEDNLRLVNTSER